MRSVVLALAVAGVSASSAAADEPVSFRRCWGWAAESDPGLRSAAEEVEQSRARARAAAGAILPDLRWTWERTWQDTTGLPAVDDPTGFGGSFVRKRSDESKFTVDQPIFGGFREWTARDGFRREAARDEERRRQRRVDLFNGVLEAFYTVRSLESRRDNVVEARGLAEKRAEDLRRRYRLGQSRESEVFSAVSQAESLRAEALRLGGEIRAARTTLSRAVGRDLGDAPLADDDAPPVQGPALAEALGAAADRPDVRAARGEVEARRARWKYERAAHWPTLSLNGNYYTDRPPFFDRINWDARLSLEAPLYGGGVTAARTAEAASRIRQAEASLADAVRVAQWDIARRHALWSASRDSLEAHRKSFDAADKSYLRHEEEYRLGLVTNLDVLQALSDRLARKTAYDDARWDALRTGWALRAAVEGAP